MSAVPIGARHNSGAYLEIVACTRQPGGSGYWLRRTCPCHRGEFVTWAPVDSWAKADALRRIMVAVATMLGT